MKYQIKCLLEYDTLRVYIRKGARFHCLSYLPTWYGGTYIQWRDYVYNQLLTFLSYVVQIDTRGKVWSIGFGMIESMCMKC